MLIRVEDIQMHVANLKIKAKGKRACVVINGDEVGIQACCDTRDQCFIIPASCEFNKLYDEYRPNATVGERRAHQVRKIAALKYQLQNRYEAVLVVDNMTAHCNSYVKDLLKANSIILLTLPPHSTHFTQPCDTASLLTIKNSFATCAVLSVVKGDHLEPNVNKHAFDKDIQQLLADNTSTAITLTPTSRRRKIAKFGILNF
ncbi:MAG: hypothetical protein EZS28_028007 [Streblomastix strix]|uniref:DDE-1 domain-containing protein n=1 Tax=Streblomastix strix TaxID=222440 RepID=A0A5J4V0G2_9EUKA|nr:MAG: hypothetical protein EZS28_028007 [Streblomastix strix]